MGSVYDAIELWSSNLYQQVRMLAENRGWGCRAYPYLLSPEPARFISVTATTLHLPGGLGASFTPRSEPVGATWVIDVRRTDGKIPLAANQGLMVTKLGPDGFGLRGAHGVLDDKQLALILDELAS